MLRNIANDLLYLLSILESIGKILKYTEKYSEPELFFESDDQIQFNASLLLLANIGEASGKISDELKNKHNKIPWKIMKNFRNKITHDYVNIDFFIGLQRFLRNRSQIADHRIDCQYFFFFHFRFPFSSFDFRIIFLQPSARI